MQNKDNNNNKILDWLDMLSDEAQAAIVSIILAFLCLAALLLIFQLTEWNFIWVLAALAGFFFAFLYLFFKFATMQKGSANAHFYANTAKPVQATAKLVQLDKDATAIDAKELAQRTEMYNFMQATLVQGIFGEGTWQKKYGWTASKYREYIKYLVDYGAIETRQGANPVRVLTFDQAKDKIAQAELKENGIKDFWGPVMRLQMPQYAGSIPFRKGGELQEIL